ncbi:glycoside hydrolase 3 protein, partial [Spiromyces aspiralis]
GAGLESIPVSAAETWPFYSDQLIDAVDFIFVHIFPFWEGKTIDDATDTIFGHIYDIEKIANGKRIIVGETGWPTAGPNYDAAVPSIDNTRTYLNNFVCRANYEKYDYFWFSAIDEGWKPTNNASNVESHWGLLDADFKPKFEGDNWIDCKNYVPNKNSKILRDASSSEDSSSSSDGKHSLHGLSSGASAEGSLESGSESSASTVATTQLALGAMTLMLGAVVNALS